jgi:ribonucleotide monophosphatase NagD (HAD superfamily)
MAENKRVVFGLDGTLIDKHKNWRPGAKGLLAKLQEKNIAPVVWTNVSKRTARDITSKLADFNYLVREVYTKKASGQLLSSLAINMAKSQDSRVVALAKEIKPNSLAKIPTAVCSNILVENDVILRQEAREFGAIVIDPAPTDEDTSPEQWTERVFASILANFPE